MGFWILAALALLLAVLLAARFCYRMIFYSLNDQPENPYVIPPGKQHAAAAQAMLENMWELDKLPFESVRITAADGETLAGKYYCFRKGGPVQIFFHGYRSNALREFSSGFQIAQKLGYNVLLVDQRAHGASGGHTISFGIRERFDCRDWANYAAQRFGPNSKLLLSGVSMGAATVLMASCLTLPETVAGITADCAYSAPGAIIRRVAAFVRLPGWLVYPFVALGAWVFGHQRLWASSPRKAVKKTDIPILLIHGTEDRFVPYEMSEQIYRCCAGPRQLELFPGAGHALSYLTDEKRYHKVFGSFLKRCGFLEQ